jgi:effector-binding domain-containing protein
MTIVSEPRIDYQTEIPYVGIRTQVPMKGMLAVVEKLVKDLENWGKQQSVEFAGFPIFRLHVIDMAGEMDIEVGFPVAKALPDRDLPDDGRVTNGVLPAGRYASVIYVGNGLTGNKKLIEWAKANGIAWDRWDDPKGDAFRSRYEILLTDPKTEHRKTKWETRIAIKLKDE